MQEDRACTLDFVHACALQWLLSLFKRIANSEDITGFDFAEVLDMADSHHRERWKGCPDSRAKIKSKKGKRVNLTFRSAHLNTYESVFLIPYLHTLYLFSFFSLPQSSAFLCLFLKVSLCLQ